MDKEKVLEKIKKCLALSKSANEHEAAQALKQAQALMRKYEMTEHDVAFSGISIEAATRTMTRRPADWQWLAAQLIGEVFGCGMVLQGNSVKFYGFGNRSLLAAYAFDVVYRQLATARRRWLKDDCRARKPRNREYLANCYCEGWLQGARKTVQKFALNEKEEGLMKSYLEDVLTAKDVGSRSVHADRRMQEAGNNAALCGVKAGKEVQLHQAMHKNEQQMIGA